MADVTRHDGFPQVAMHPEDQLFSLFVVRAPAGEREIRAAKVVGAVDIEQENVMPITPKTFDIFPNANIGKRIRKSSCHCLERALSAGNLVEGFSVCRITVKGKGGIAVFCGKLEEDDVRPIFLYDICLPRIDPVSFDAIFLDEARFHANVSPFVQGRSRAFRRQRTLFRLPWGGRGRVG